MHSNVVLRRRRLLRRSSLTAVFVTFCYCDLEFVQPTFLPGRSEGSVEYDGISGRDFPARPAEVYQAVLSEEQAVMAKDMNKGALDPLENNIVLSSQPLAMATSAKQQPMPSSPAPVPGDKVVVMGKTQYEDTSWVAEFLPDWHHAIYTVDNTSYSLHTTHNKGREANPYLTYIISRYDSLPSTIAFIHPHLDGYPTAWHTDSVGYSNVNSLQTLNIAFVQRNGYANLRCLWEPGCPSEIQPFRDPPHEDGEGRVTESVMREVWPMFFGDRVRVPEVIATPCCAQFAVSRQMVLRRGKKKYERYHQWLMETELEDDISGRVFEYLWHVIFGMEAVYCPDLTQCYADVYGRQF